MAWHRMARNGMRYGIKIGTCSSHIPLNKCSLTRSKLKYWTIIIAQQMFLRNGSAPFRLVYGWPKTHVRVRVLRLLKYNIYLFIFNRVFHALSVVVLNQHTHTHDTLGIWCAYTSGMRYALSVCWTHIVAYWNTELQYYISNLRCIQCAMCHAILSIQAHTKCVCVFVCSTGEEMKHIVFVVMLSTVSKHVSNPLQSMMYTSIEHVIFCVVCECFFSAVLHTFLFLLHCLMCHSSVLLYCVNELNRSLRKTEPNRCACTVR